MRAPIALALLLMSACGGDPGAGGGDDDGADDEVDASPTTRGIIDGPIGEWAWYDIPGTVCANGTPTGLGVNQGPGDQIVLYMSPGSACLDESCSIGTPSQRKDGGFRAPQLAACVAGDCDGGITFPAASIFSRASEANPFRDATFVFISVCSGDYYVGDNEHVFPSWTARFQGSRNQALFAAELAASFPDASRVIVTGASAGSVGAMLNYWQWVAAFPDTRVDSVSDSFTLVHVDRPEFRYDLHAPRVPPACATCATDYRTVHDFNASIAPPGARIAVIDSEENWTLVLTNGSRYTQGLQALQPRLDLHANTRYYVADGNVHVLLRHPLDSALTDVADADAGTHLLGEFLSRMQDDAAGAWESWTCL